MIRWAHVGLVAPLLAPLPEQSSAARIYPDEFTTGGLNENANWMRRRFPYLGSSYVGGSQGLHKRCSGGRYCGPFRRTPWSAWSGGRLRDRPSPSEQTCKNAAQSDWPRRGAPLARRSPLKCGRDSVRACAARLEALVDHHSGLLGISGIDNRMRRLHDVLRPTPTHGWQSECSVTQFANRWRP
jgi:hypothetical protein